MVARPEPPRWSVEAYLEMERGSAVRHDYLDGHVYAMAGGSRRHSRIGVNVTTALNILLRGGPCQVFNSDMMVRIDAKNYVYPDASVSCDPSDTADDEAASISRPSLIVEILSDDSTAGYDRGDTFNLLYKRIETLREYVLVDTQRIAVDVHRRGTDEDWNVRSYVAGDEVSSESLDATIPIVAFYEPATPSNVAPS